MALSVSIRVRPSFSSGGGGGGSLLEYLNTNLRYIDWSGAGVTGGIEQYMDGGANARTLGANVMDYGADNTGSTNCSTAFTNAQAACSPGEYVYIPDGDYLISGTVGHASNITWRGQSVKNTIIHFSGGGMFNNSAQWPAPEYDTDGVSVTGGALRGSDTLTVASTATFSVGGLAQLTQLTPFYAHPNDDNSWAAQSWFGYDETRLSAIMFRVESINETTHQITLDHPLPCDMTSSPLLMPRSCNREGIGYENIQFDCTNSTGNQVLLFVNAANCWIYQCYFKTMYDRSAWIEECVNMTVKHCYSDHGQGLGRNCEGLDFVGNACWCLVEDNIFHSAGYPMVMLGDWQGGCYGNVIAYNFQNGFDQGYDTGTFPLTMDDSHGPPCEYNLWEGNVGEVFGTDGYYGSAAHGMYFRNRIWGTTSEVDYADQTCFELNHWSYKYSIIGNILGTWQGASWNTTGRYSQVYEASGTSSQQPQIYRLGYPDMGNRGYTGTGENPSDASYYDTGVASTLLRHGNYDYVTETVIWDEAIEDHSLPESMYLAAKPSWWGALDWPGIGPDVTGYTKSIPALTRWNAYLVSGDLDDLF